MGLFNREVRYEAGPESEIIIPGPDPDPDSTKFRSRPDPGPATDPDPWHCI